MLDLTQAGKVLLVMGGLCLLLGGILLFAKQVPWLGQLPGDFSYETENVKVYVPLTTMLIISLVLTLLLNVIARS